MEFRHAVVLDFEATCQEGQPLKPQEIIEFPSVLVDLEKGLKTAEFKAFVRPVHHPQLTLSAPN
jgi:ERI1 exoribonuclease 2